MAIKCVVSFGAKACFSILALVSLFHPANATECPVSASNPAEAQARADWIMDGTIDDFFLWKESDKLPEINLRNVKILRAIEPFTRAKTRTLDIFTCRSGDLKQIDGQAGQALIGKRMRFFGTTTDGSPRRRFFYTQLLDRSDQPLAIPGLTFAEAKNIWENGLKDKEYMAYASQFIQYNNHFHIDEKDNCYGLSKGPQELLLVITHFGSEEYSRVEQVLTDKENAKGLCFQRSYNGIPTKTPPTLPYVLQLNMK